MSFVDLKIENLLRVEPYEDLAWLETSIKSLVGYNVSLENMQAIEVMKSKFVYDFYTMELFDSVIEKLTDLKKDDKGVTLSLFEEVVDKINTLKDFHKETCLK